MSAAAVRQAEAYAKGMNPDDRANDGPCMACGRRWPMLLLDGKPGADDLAQARAALIAAGEDPAGAAEAANFNRLEGPCCYGPGYSTP